MAKIESTLFDKGSRLAGADRYYKVEIRRPSTQETINGYMQEGLSLDFNPEYTTLGAAIPLLGQAAGKIDALSILESPLLFDGSHTQKMYNGSSHMSIGLKLKVVDELGNGLPIEYARILASWCQPLDFDAFKKDLGDKAEVAKTVGQKLLDGKDIVLNDNSITEKIGALNNTLADIGNTVTGLSRMALNVKIGDFFKGKQFVITGVSQQFSHEHGIAGPLWAEFDVKLESLKVLTSNEIKTYFYENKDSVTIRGERINFISG